MPNGCSMRDPDLPEAASALEALQQAHSELAARLAPLLARAMTGGEHAPEWAMVERLTEKMEAISAMIDVCPCPALSARPPTDTLN